MQTAPIDLEALRKDAKLSQEALGVLLGKALGMSPIPQSTISRYEGEPDDVPLKVVRKWMECCGKISANEGLDYGDPYKEMRDLVAAVEAMPSPPALPAPMFDGAPTHAALLSRLKELGRKPRVAICGKYDAGKSRLANTLLGGDRLPTGYQPATRIVNFVRHLSARPEGLREEVFLLPKGFFIDDKTSAFDFGFADDKDRIQDRKVVAGSFDTLKLYGTHGDDLPPGADECDAALVFIDSPFLLGCDLVDLPGYGDPDEEGQAALAQRRIEGDTSEFNRRLADIVIYASTAQGFMDSADIHHLDALLKMLPPIGGAHPLRNLYVVATMANMSEDQVEAILDKAHRRVSKHIADSLTERDGGNIEPESLRARFFPFLVEDRRRRDSFAQDLSELLGKTMPTLVRTWQREAVTEMKASAIDWCGQWTSRLAEALENRERAGKALEDFEKGEPERVARIDAKKVCILNLIDEGKNATRSFVAGPLSEILTPANVEATIRARHKDRKEAIEQAAPYFAELVGNKLDAFLAVHADRLRLEIDEILKDYQDASVGGASQSIGAMSIPFDAKGAFIGALAGTGTAGALAAWASAVAAGSNLGSYILVARVVSFLSSIGIGVGGTASAASAVAAIGGPVTIVVGLAALAVIGGYALFGSSWERRLAKKICEVMEHEKYLARLTERADQYWDDTRAAFMAAIDGTEVAFQANIESMRNLAKAVSAAEIAELIGCVVANRNHFASIPWEGGSPCSS